MQSTALAKWEYHIQLELLKVWEWTIILKNHLSAAHIPR